MNRLSRLPALLLIVSLCAGCATNIRVERSGTTLVGIQHFFVVANSNDNHGINSQIAAALTARGLYAETGPLTMMPDETAAIVSYQDHWTWDFGDHLIYLQVAMKDRKSGNPLGRSTFSVKFPTRKPTPEIIGELVETLLAPSH